MKIITKHFVFINALLTRRYKFLLIVLLAYLTLPGFTYGLGIQKTLAYVIQSILLFASINAVQETKKQFNIGLSLGVLLITVNLLGLFQEDATINFYLTFFIYMLFYAFVSYKLLMKVFRTEKVNIGVLFASINVYLLIGIVGAFAFMLIENAHPGSLINLSLESLTNPAKFIYFSFSTMTTLGYGDITPVSPPAQSLAILLAVFGPVYLTVLVAIMVGRYITSHNILQEKIKSERFKKLN